MAKTLCPWADLKETQEAFFLEEAPGLAETKDRGKESEKVLRLALGKAAKRS